MIAGEHPLSSSFSRAASLLRQCAERAGDGVYVGSGEHGWVWSRPQHAVLVVGPPRSGKTSSIVIPAITAARGPVVSTSTKTEVMAATARVRDEIGQCFLFDPTGTVDPPTGVRTLQWSPVDSAGDWDRALTGAHAMVATSRPPARGESRHWTERAESLLAPLLHAAAIEGLPMAQVVRWVHRHEALEALEILRGAGAELPADLLHGITVTDTREQSGIWSTASGVLAPYRGLAALVAAGGNHNGAYGNGRPGGDGLPGGGLRDAVRFDGDAFARSCDTIYICAPGRQQEMVAPLIVGLLDEVRSAAYRLADDGSLQRPALLALDEIANIAPIPDLPSLVSEGGGQGVVTLACIQDLSQARERWGAAASGFFTLFGTKVILPGVADMATIDPLSRLAGSTDVAVRSVTAPQWWSALRQGSSVTWSLREKSVLPPEEIARGVPGSALVIESMDLPQSVRLTPYFACEPWRALTGADAGIDVSIDTNIDFARDSQADRQSSIARPTELPIERSRPGLSHER